MPRVVSSPASGGTGQCGIGVDRAGVRVARRWEVGYPLNMIADFVTKCRIARRLSFDKPNEIRVAIGLLFEF